VTVTSRVPPGLERRVLRTLLGLPAAWAVWLAGAAARAAVANRADGTADVDDGLLDPSLQLIFALQRRRGVYGSSAGTAEATRRLIRHNVALAAGVPTPVGRVHHLRVPGADGMLRARHYAPLPAGGGPQPLLVYLHGGGFVAGDLDTHDEPCRLLCRHAGVHVLAVEYRLAPEFPFPAGVDDAYAATQWALAHAGDLDADPARVAVGGDSAGANLAAVACLLARRRDAPAPAAQLLLYPPTDYHGPWRSRTVFADSPMLTGEDIEFFHAQYSAGEDPDDERHSPLRAADLSGLPPAMVVTAALDPLRDEGEAYAEALRGAGNRVVAWRVPGLVHGFANLTTVSRTAHDSVVEIAGALRALLASAEVAS